ncbi:MAG: LPS export ABC transporter ATP-binding protein [Flavobacteriaceae bacterium TMED238]|nr:LPS export ABC transporter ATP-binding protein [Flavobacteriaceae bacterium]RPG61511.1 MAG: LPS export ABC transporter ATP-binding protein [Flavobacteriaceae bacterium TMED238]
MLLKVKNLSKTYEDKVAVKDISFEMNSGETLGILGPNGAGKTTLFYMIAGLVKSDRGQIRLGENNLNEHNISQRTALGLAYLPQESSIFKGLTVEENILSALEQRGDIEKQDRKEILESLLEDFNLLEFSKTIGVKLSGGERRRTEIARSLATNPKFVLLDEPFAGIDPIAVSDLKDTIYRLNDKNIGVLISDHNVRDTMNICKKVLIVNKGEIIANGKPSDIVRDSIVKKVYLGEDF